MPLDCGNVKGTKLCLAQIDLELYVIIFSLTPVVYSSTWNESVSSVFISTHHDVYSGFGIKKTLPSSDKHHILNILPLATFSSFQISKPTWKEQNS